MVHSKDIEQALAKVRNQASFLRLLSDTLRWPLDGEAVEDVSYEWTEKDLRAAGLERKLVDSRIFQIANLDKNQPWGVFVIEFKHADAFVTERGMTGVLRKILRGLVPSARKDSTQPSWKREHLLFICTHKYEHYRFAYFKAPREGSKTAPLAAFGWGPDIPARTASEFNLPALEWPDSPKDSLRWVTAWAEAFSVEKVTKRFYTDYAAHFETLKARIHGVTGEDQKMFTQTLMNRLMFLRFIERKGWLTPPGGQKSKDYLRLLFAAGDHRGRSFYAGRLRKLFFEALAVEGKQSSEAVGQVPFLNGGLFEESELDRKVADIPNAAFEPLLGEDGLFYRYNFTVQESTPLDIEVAVDPEMLGKVFEELVTGRHESGSYYTPRPVVSFMCREALKGYLTDTTRLDADAIAAFVDKHDVTGIRVQDAKKIVAALDTLRAVDPACGSGAYLLGLLHEIVDLYRALYSDKLKQDARELHSIKLNIIQNSLYGVDIDPFATNIAMLRLWLSLTVDSDRPEALPNLDFKIETGDSVSGPNPDTPGNLLLAEPARQLAIIKGQYMRARGEQKASLRRLVLAEQRKVADLQRSVAAASGDVPANVVDWRVQFCEVFYPSGTPAATLEGEFAFVNSIKHQRVLLEPTHGDRPGFDIVLANPPYVRHELIKHLKPALKKAYGDLYSGTADLYVFFYLRALQLLAPGGMLVFISSNKWLRAAYGLQLRRRIGASTQVKSITDFGELPVFETAATFPCIFIAQRGLGSQSFPFTQVKSLDPPYPDVQALIAKTSHSVPVEALRTEPWHLGDTGARTRLRRMSHAGKTLGEYISEEFYVGLKTGCNEAFWIDGVTRSRLIEKDPRSAELIHKLAVGDDVRKWRINDNDRWMIVTPIGVDMKRYPVVLSHLRAWKDRLEQRGDRGNEWWELRPCDYYDKFRGAKIIYPEIAKEPRFTYDEEGTVTNNKAFIIARRDLYLLGVLNSSPAWEFIRATCAVIGDEASGGRVMLQWVNLRCTPIPTASAADREAIGALARKCLDARGIGCEAWEREIDDRVAALYGIDLKDIGKSDRD